MSREILLPEVIGLMTPNSNLVRPSIIEMLRLTSTDIDREKQEYLKRETWQKGTVWFHSLQDTRHLFYPGMLGVLERKGRLAEEATQVQACFVKDLDDYMAGFPPEEETVLTLFQAIYDAGTSFYWKDDLKRVDELHRVYNEINTQVLHPWIHGT